MSEAAPKPATQPLTWIGIAAACLAALVSLSTLLDQKYALKSDVVRLETKLDGQSQQMIALTRAVERQGDILANQQQGPARQRVRVVPEPQVDAATSFPRIVAKLSEGADTP